MLDRILEHHGWELQKAALVDLDSSMLFMLALFLVLLVILNKTFMQPMLAVFDKRHELTDGAKEAAAVAVKRAEERIATYEERVGESRRQGANLQKQVRQEAVDKERELIEGVRRETDAQIARGVSDLAATQSRAEAELQAKAQDLGDRIVKRILGGAA